MNTHNKGIIGEDIATIYLSRRKYKILERNYQAKHGEIDIVAKDGNYYVFVEVKRRQTDKFGLPREAVTWQKQRSIISAANQWLVSNKLYGVPVRFDVVDILDDEITLLKDAFRA